MRIREDIHVFKIEREIKMRKRLHIYRVSVCGDKISWIRMWL